VETDGGYFNKSQKKLIKHSKKLWYRRNA